VKKHPFLAHELDSIILVDITFLVTKMIHVYAISIDIYFSDMKHTVLALTDHCWDYGIKLFGIISEPFLGISSGSESQKTMVF